MFRPNRQHNSPLLQELRLRDFQATRRQPQRSLQRLHSNFYHKNGQHYDSAPLLVNVARAPKRKPRAYTHSTRGSIVQQLGRPPSRTVGDHEGGGQPACRNILGTIHQERSIGPFPSLAYFGTLSATNRVAFSLLIKNKAASPGLDLARAFSYSDAFFTFSLFTSLMRSPSAIPPV
jgi:hypothetical protein